MHAAKARVMNTRLAERPLKEEDLKGKVDIKWFGHGGFKVAFKDKEDKQRVMYFDLFVQNEDCPEEDRKEPPNDADLVFVTCGQQDCSHHSIDLIKFSKKEKR